jgi:transposase
VLDPPHGNRQGLSHGRLTVGVIAYILTECNHFLSPVRDWVLARRRCLSHALGQPLRDTDFTDDRLEDLLDALGADEVGEPIEVQMGQRLIRAYELPTNTGRIDTTMASVYHQPQGQSLLAFGQSKEQRPSLQQFKELLGTLDPAGVPLCSATMGRQRADDPLIYPLGARWSRLWVELTSCWWVTARLRPEDSARRIQTSGGYHLTPYQ